MLPTANRFPDWPFLHKQAMKRDVDDDDDDDNDETQ